MMAVEGHRTISSRQVAVQSHLAAKVTQVHGLLGSGVHSFMHIFHFEVLCPHFKKGHNKGPVLGTGTVESTY